MLPMMMMGTAWAKERPKKAMRRVPYTTYSTFQIAPVHIQKSALGVPQRSSAVTCWMPRRSIPMEPPAAVPGEFVTVWVAAPARFASWPTVTLRPLTQTPDCDREQHDQTPVAAFSVACQMIARHVTRTATTGKFLFPERDLT